jgi:hypothetical protein
MRPLSKVEARLSLFDTPQSTHPHTLDNDQPYDEDESDEEYLTPSASDKSQHDHAN